MAIIKCKMCGGDLTLVEGASTAECEFCGSIQTIPKVDDEKKITLFARANRLRAACEFDKAAGIYEAIVADFPEEAEAYWGLVLCTYGIEYVDDPATGRKIPTCHRSGFESVMKDPNVDLAQEYADVAARRIYRAEAKQIEELRKGIIAVSANEEPYDIFICYKETGFDGRRALDSVLAQDIYDALTDKDYRVFFSRISLEDKLGTEYEPYIFAALNSAKIMLVVGTDFEHFNAVWVKNEWSRFLKLMAQDKSRHLIPCYKGIDAYDMPEEFARLQAQDLDKMGAIQDIVRGVQKLLPKQKQEVLESTTIPQATVASNIAPLLKRIFLFLEDEEWDHADEYCEKVLDVDPECAQAYLGKLLAEMRVSAPEQLANCVDFTKDNNTYKKLLRFADASLKKTLEQYLKKAEIHSRYAAAEAAFKENATIENGVLQEYYGEETDIYIPYSVTSIGDFVFSKRKNLTSVVIPKSVTSIGQCAFYGCESLTSVTLQEGVTDIGISAFSQCKNLTSVTIPKSVISIGLMAFGECESLTSVTLQDGVNSIDSFAFSQCKSLASIYIPDSVTDIGSGAFAGCSRLKEIIVSAENEHYCVMNGHLVDVNTRTLVIGIGAAQIPEGVTSIGKRAFSESEALTSVTIPKGVTSIGDNAFSRCESLVSVTIPDDVYLINQNPFSGCSGLKEIVVSAGNKCYCAMNGHLVDAKTKTLIAGIGTARIPEGVTSIGPWAFQYCKNLTSVTIPQSVTSIEGFAFDECKNLTSVTIPKSVTSIKYKAFNNNVTIFTPLGSAAWKWAEENKIKVQEDEQTKQARIAAELAREEEKRIVQQKERLKKKEEEYLSCVEAMKVATSAGRYDYLAQRFLALSPYKDSIQLHAQCQAASIRIKKENQERASVYNKALDSLTQAKKVESLSQKESLAKEAEDLFRSIPGYGSSITFANEAAELYRVTRERIQTEEELRIRREKWQRSGKCQHCGGDLKGLFSKKCVSCGKPKDY